MGQLQVSPTHATGTPPTLKWRALALTTFPPCDVASPSLTILRIDKSPPLRSVCCFASLNLHAHHCRNRWRFVVLRVDRRFHHVLEHIQALLLALLLARRA